jgi:hypothetical protein
MSNCIAAGQMIALAKEIREVCHRGEDLGLTEDETAFS